MKPQSHFEAPSISKPKGDSFFREFDDDKLNFSKTIDSANLKTFNLTKTSKLAPSSSPLPRDPQTKGKTQNAFKKRPKQNLIHFVDHDQLEISPVNSDDEAPLSVHQDTLNEEIQANLNKTYKMGFAWGDSGSVEIRSMKYSIEYCTHAAGFKLKSSENSFLRTELRWEVSEAYEGVFEFFMRDQEVCNLTTGKNVKLVLPGLEFLVDFRGNLLRALNLKEVATTLYKRHRKQNLKNRPTRADEIKDKGAYQRKIEEIEDSLWEKIGELWELVVENWYSYEESSEFSSAQELDGNVKDQSDPDLEFLTKIGEFDHYGKNCLLLTNGIFEDKKTIKSHILQKLLNPKTSAAIEKSQKFIIDPLNAWELKGSGVELETARRKG